MKDRFSVRSDRYALYRPGYPKALFEFLAGACVHKKNAWDCGTGNGQVAKKLALWYENVYATDISQAQIDQALKLENILYSVQPAEMTDFPNDFFDLITVAQAIHWFDFEKFYDEVRRTAKHDAVLAIIGYGKLTLSPEIDKIIDRLYEDIIGSYWDRERKYIDENYRTIPFPFKEIEVPSLENSYYWDFEHLIGYLNTWSAVKHYSKDQGSNPVDLVYHDLKDKWSGEQQRKVSFPLLLRIGKIHF